MAKRLIDTSIWNQNKWFRKLSAQHKLFWIYLFCNCDAVGVWEEDLELVSFILNFEFNRKEIDEIFAGKIKWINNKKLWIIDFCNFQYGTLKEENITNKPHQSYISLLKKHSLWKDYTKTIHSHKEKEIDKDIEKDIDKEKEKKYDFSFVEEKWFSLFNEWISYKKSRNENYKTQKSLEACYRNLLKLSNDDIIRGRRVLDQAMGNNWAGLFPLKEFESAKNFTGYIDGKR